MGADRVTRSVPVDNTSDRVMRVEVMPWWLVYELAPDASINVECVGPAGRDDPFVHRTKTTALISAASWVGADARFVRRTGEPLTDWTGAPVLDRVDEVAVRRDFASFIERLAARSETRYDWPMHILQMYGDERLNEIRRQIVRLRIADGDAFPTERGTARLLEWATELQQRRTRGVR